MIVRFYSSNNMIFHCNCHFTFWFTTATQSCRAASRCAPLSLAGVGRHWQLSAVCWGFTREHRAAHPPITAPLPFHIPAPVPLLQPSSPTADKLNAALLHTGSWHRHRADLILFYVWTQQRKKVHGLICKLLPKMMHRMRPMCSTLSHSFPCA